MFLWLQHWAALLITLLHQGKTFKISILYQMIDVFRKQLCNKQDNVIRCSPWGLLPIMTSSLWMCLIWQPVAAQRLGLLLPVISQSRIISVGGECNVNITHWHLTYWCYRYLTDIHIILSWFWEISVNTQITTSTWLFQVEIIQNRWKWCIKILEKQGTN